MTGWRTAVRRTAPLIGVGGVGLLIVGNEVGKIGGDSPSLHASAAEYAQAVGSTGAVIVGTYVVVVGWLGLAGFFRVVGERLREAADGERAARLVTTGGALAAVVGISGAAPSLTAAIMTGDGDLSPETATALLLLNAAAFVLSWLLIAVPLAVSAAAGMRVHVLGRGIGWSGIVIGAALGIASLGVWFAEACLLVWMVALIWILVASVALTLRARRTVRADVPAARRTEALA